MNPSDVAPAPERLPGSSDQLQLRAISDAARTFPEATTDYERLLDSIARNLSDVFKDSRCVFLLSEDGTSMRAASLHANDPAALEQIRGMFLDKPLRLTEQPALKRILETEEPLLVPSLDQVAARSDTTQEQVSWQRRLGLHSFLVVALRAHRRAIGVLTMGASGPRRPPSPDRIRSSRKVWRTTPPLRSRTPSCSPPHRTHGAARSRPRREHGSQSRPIACCSRPFWWRRLCSRSARFSCWR